jgi:hypothetical protein
LAALPFRYDVEYTPDELEVLSAAQDLVDELNEAAERAYEARGNRTTTASAWQEWQAERGSQLLLTERDMLSYPKPPILVDDLLVAGTLASLISEPGLGKSFIALDLALSIASGQPTFVGFPLRVSGPVVYVVGEGGGRFKAAADRLAPASRNRPRLTVLLDERPDQPAQQRAGG